MRSSLQFKVAFIKCDLLNLALVRSTMRAESRDCGVNLVDRGCLGLSQVISG